MTREEAMLLLHDMKDTYDEIHENTNCEIGYEQMTALDMAIEALSIDAVQGEWQKVEEQPYFRKHYDTVCCSVCRKKGNRKWNFCPNCGARMKGGAE